MVRGKPSLKNAMTVDTIIILSVRMGVSETMCTYMGK